MKVVTLMAFCFDGFAYILIYRWVVFSDVRYRVVRYLFHLGANIYLD